MDTQFLNELVTLLLSVQTDHAIGGSAILAFVGWLAWLTRRISVALRSLHSPAVASVKKVIEKVEKVAIKRIKHKKNALDNDVTQRAMELMREVELTFDNGEARRHQVYARLLKEFPDLSKRGASRLIEDVLDVWQP